MALRDRIGNAHTFSRWYLVQVRCDYECIRLNSKREGNERLAWQDIPSGKIMVIYTSMESLPFGSDSHKCLLKDNLPIRSLLYQG